MEIQISNANRDLMLMFRIPGDKQYTLRDMYCIDLHKMDQWKPIVELNAKELEWFDSDSESEGSEDGDEDMEDSGSDEESD